MLQLLFFAIGLSGITFKKDNVGNTQLSKKNAIQNQRLLHNCDYRIAETAMQKYDSKFIPAIGQLTKTNAKETTDN